MADNLRFFAALAPEPGRSHGTQQESSDPEFDHFENMRPGSRDFHGFETTTLAYADYQRRKQTRDPSIARKLQRTKTQSTSSILETTQRANANEVNQPDLDSEASRSIQKKLEVSPADDPLEKDADEVADRVMRTPSADAAQKPTISPTNWRMQGRNLPGEFVGPDGSQKINRVLDRINQSRGNKMSTAERDFFEPRFGRSFEDVRIHTGPEAEGAAADLQAKAFATGNDVFFGKGEYAPNMDSGKHLMAHELAHVVQQSGGSADSGTVQRSPLNLNPTNLQTPSLSESQIEQAQNENRRLHDYDAGLTFRLGRVAGNQRLRINADLHARSVAFHPDRAIGRDFVLLVAAVQQRIGVPVTGILDARTQQAGRGVLEFVDKVEIDFAVSAIIKSIPNTLNKFDREAIVITLRNAEKVGLLSRTLSELKRRSGEVDQTSNTIIPYIYGRLREFREPFAKLIEKSNSARDIAGVRAAQIRESDDPREIHDLLTKLSGPMFAYTLELLEDFTSDPINVQGTSDETLFVDWLFYEKLNDDLQREKVRRHFLEQNASAQFYAAVYAAKEVTKLLATERRIESDAGILMFFKTTPQRERSRLLGRLAIETRDRLGQSAEEALQSKMLPDNFNALKDVPGLNLNLQVRVLSSEEQAAVTADYAAIVAEILAGIPAGLGQGIAQALGDLVMMLAGGATDTVITTGDALLAYIYLTSNGIIGVESFERITQSLANLKQFAEDPIGMALATLEAAWEDTVLGSEVIVGPGSTGRSVQYWVSVGTRFTANLALIVGAAVAGARSVINRLRRLKAGRRVKERRIRLEAEERRRRDEREHDTDTDQMRDESTLVDETIRTPYDNRNPRAQAGEIEIGQMLHDSAESGALPGYTKVYGAPELTGQRSGDYRFVTETGLEVSADLMQPTSGNPRSIALNIIEKSGQAEIVVVELGAGKSIQITTVQAKKMADDVVSTPGHSIKQVIIVKDKTILTSAP